MPLNFAAELAYASRELTRIRADLLHADATGLSHSAQLRERSASTRAYAYIWLAAVLERVVNDALKDVLQELSALTLPGIKFRASLFALICDSQLTSIAARGPNPAWDVRLELLDRMLDPAPIVFNQDTLPLDGRTLRGEHFDRIWLVFGVPGTSLPGPQHRLALRDLAEGRNMVAHGGLDPITFGRAKAVGDVIKLVGRVDEIVIHLLAQLDAYVRGSHYIR